MLSGAEALVLTVDEDKMGALGADMVECGGFFPEVFVVGRCAAEPESCGGRLARAVLPLGRVGVDEGEDAVDVDDAEDAWDCLADRVFLDRAVSCAEESDHLTARRGADHGQA